MDRGAGRAGAFRVPGNLIGYETVGRGLGRVVDFCVPGNSTGYTAFDPGRGALSWLSAEVDGLPSTTTASPTMTTTDISRRPPAAHRE